MSDSPLLLKLTHIMCYPCLLQLLVTLHSDDDDEDDEEDYEAEQRPKAIHKVEKAAKPVNRKLEDHSRPEIDVMEQVKEDVSSTFTLRVLNSKLNTESTYWRSQYGLQSYTLVGAKLKVAPLGQYSAGGLGPFCSSTCKI